MNERFDIYYKDGRCRLVEAARTPKFIKEQWQHGFSFYAFPANFLPIPKHCTRFVTYFRSKYPFDTYAMYSNSNPLDEFYELDTEPINLTTTFTAFSDITFHTVPLYIYERSVGELKSIFISPIHAPPVDIVFSATFVELPFSPIGVATRPVNRFQCMNTICVPAVFSTLSMLTYPDWEDIQNHPELAEILTNKTMKTTSSIFKHVKESDISKYRKVYDNIYNCIHECRESNEKSYQYPIIQKDLAFL